MQFLWKVSMDFVDSNVDNGHENGIFLSSSFFEEIIAVFKLKIISNWHRNRQKTEIFKLSKFYADLWNFSIEFVDLNVENGHQRGTFLSSSFFKRQLRFSS